MTGSNFYHKFLLYSLSLFFISIGFLHFVFDEFLLRIIPPFLPCKSFIIYFSGILEIVLGIGLLFPRIRSLVAWIMIFHLIVVFPANIYMFMHKEQFVFIPVWAHYLRPPLQLVFIAWAYCCTKLR